MAVNLFSLFEFGQKYKRPTRLPKFSTNYLLRSTADASRVRASCSASSMRENGSGRYPGRKETEGICTPKKWNVSDRTRSRKGEKRERRGRVENRKILCESPGKYFAGVHKESKYFVRTRTEILALRNKTAQERDESIIQP